MNISRASHSAQLTSQLQQVALHPNREKTIVAINLADVRCVCQRPGSGSGKNDRTRSREWLAFGFERSQEQTSISSVEAFAPPRQSGKWVRVTTVLVGDSTGSGSQPLRGFAAVEPFNGSLRPDASHWARYPRAWRQRDTLSGTRAGSTSGCAFPGSTAWASGLPGGLLKFKEPASSDKSLADRPLFAGSTPIGVPCKRSFLSRTMFFVTMAFRRSVGDRNVA